MHCGACVRRVQAALAKTPGLVVEVVEVGRARGKLAGGTVDAAIAAVTAAGYPARVE
ncbi:MAG: cation transporter [Kofleriaceae bacterium]|nr:cation transporter [Kofleriaceae bacterium]MBP9166975.1 cation transporter [Kofleriaceae bacterium]MBP9858286.1 cation transporter [Kofleriaceae bacterium]